ncbi:signal peptidase II [Sphingomonas nostoxanthinifaciens]|uniref:signal peptidase II n=1 Tax=Sphingomonas nostoxanthinifaciens TaxID=2872652 RepID=UPI001CC1C737|nr:signal peptidase II [Sphingomonas nostoxanthinifaciens]UAK24890.1 signal peptidase II [Sphingomonas nostoxanthinifaciens]
MTGVRTYRRLGFLVAALVLLADQTSKYVIMRHMLLAERDGGVDLLPVFRLLWVENRGVSMGFLTAGSDAQRWALTLFTAAIAVGVAVWLWRERRRVDAVALGLVMGGAVGNILDRTRLGFVADFLNLHFGAWSPFLVFNVADAAISIGVALLVLRALLSRDAPPPSESLK